MFLTFEQLSEALESTQTDGRKRNLICDCPYCGKNSKFGVSLVKEDNPFRCFSCNEVGRIKKLMLYIGRSDLIVDFTVIENEINNPLEEIEDDNLDLELELEDLPPKSKRMAKDPYLEKRGWDMDSYQFLEVYRTKEFKYRDYVIFPVRMYGDLVGYVSRHTWDKKEIEKFNRKAKKNDTYQILRYKNSEGNEFGKMLYGFDLIIEGVTKTAILVEGLMDVENLSKNMNLYERDEIKAVATFGKKISVEQIYHLQSKGIENIVIFYDPDAIEDIKKMQLEKYFNVLVASIDEASNVRAGDDAGDVNYDQISEIWENLLAPHDFFYNKVEVVSL